MVAEDEQAAGGCWRCWVTARGAWAVASGNVGWLRVAPKFTECWAVAPSAVGRATTF